MRNTGIEWCHHTVNFWWGCVKVSLACLHCYAETLAKLFSHGRASWGPNGLRWIRTTAALRELRKLDKSAGKRGVEERVFVNSMSDTFEDRRDLDTPRAELFRVAGSITNLQLLLLTKRPENIRHMVPKSWLEKGGWPAHVWVGVTVENQEMADLRIPLLIDVPAKVRFLSCEPLLGPVDLEGWGPQAATASPFLPFKMPETWDQFDWPSWVTEEQRKQIISFWGPYNRRKPAEWAEDNVVQRTPGFGAVMGYDKHRWVCKQDDPAAIGVGRYMHAWNNMGRIFTEDGKVVGVASSNGPGWLSRWLIPAGDYRHRIHWIICGGESGGKARPMHPDWARNLRDQCQRQKVAFFHKQWGEFLPADLALPLQLHGAHEYVPRHEFCNAIPQLMVRVGKKAAGRELDGQLHDAVPTP